MRSWKIIAIITIGLLLISCGGGKPAPATLPPPTAPSPPAIDASSLYATTCVACHGVNRQGISGLGPALTPESLAARSDTELKDTISNGRPNTAMPPWKDTLKSQEIDALVQFLKHTSP